MEPFLAILAAAAATLFSLDLWSDYRRRPRPHVAAYATGISMFAVATWALFVGMTFGWTGAAYRTFYLFGAILNIPILALGSMFLVVGKKSGHGMTIAIGALAAISTTLTLTIAFDNPLPRGGVPEHIFGLGFTPRLFAIIGGAAGSTILVALALTSLIRFWKRQRAIVWGNGLILGGGYRCRVGWHRPGSRRRRWLCVVVIAGGKSDLGGISGGVWQKGGRCILTLGSGRRSATLPAQSCRTRCGLAADIAHLHPLSDGHRL